MTREVVNANYDSSSLRLTMNAEEAGAMVTALLLASWAALSMGDMTKYELYNRMYQQLTSPVL